MGSIDSDMFVCKLCSKIYRSPPGDPLGCSSKHAHQIADMQMRAQFGEFERALRNLEFRTEVYLDRSIASDQASEDMQELLLVGHDRADEIFHRLIEMWPAEAERSITPEQAGEDMRRLLED